MLCIVETKLAVSLQHVKCTATPDYQKQELGLQATSNHIHDPFHSK